MDSFPDSTDYYAIYEQPRPVTDSKAVMDKEKRAEIIAKKHYVENDWNFSPQCKLLGHYQKDLEDCYPRDPVTRLPHRDAAPKYLGTHKNVPISAFSDVDSYQRERRVMFQPETILDAQTKVKYSEDELKNKPQVFLNICNDLGSQMFQREYICLCLLTVKHVFLLNATCCYCVHATLNLFSSFHMNSAVFCLQSAWFRGSNAQHRSIIRLSIMPGWSSPSRTLTKQFALSFYIIIH